MRGKRGATTGCEAPPPIVNLRRNNMAETIFVCQIKKIYHKEDSPNIEMTADIAKETFINDIANSDFRIEVTQINLGE